MDNTMPVSQEEEESDQTDRPMKKLRFDEALDNLASVSDYNANLAPSLVDRQIEELNQSRRDSRLETLLTGPTKDEEDVDKGKGVTEVATDANENSENYYIEGDFENLSSEQNELLHSAVESYIYLPKTTLQKVYKEFNAETVEKGSPTIHWSKTNLKSWLRKASNFYDHMNRWELITHTLEQQNNNISEDESSQIRPKENRRLTFQDKVSVRKFFTAAPATISHVLELEEVDLVSEEKQDWTTEELEVLETAIEAYKYFPKAVVKKVHKELRSIVDSREVKIFSKLQISNWYRAALASEACDMKHYEELGSVRWKVRDRLEEMRSKDPEEEEPRNCPVKIRFTEMVEVNIFDVNSPVSRLVGDMNGEIDTLKEL